MKTLPLGSQGLHTSQLGLGCMGMSEFYGAIDDVESIKVIHRAIDLGVTFLDTADAYGPLRTKNWWERLSRGKETP
jgi:aryl-alcohol dehydrogenase-like predicted oxidoreductase